MAGARWGRSGAGRSGGVDGAERSGVGGEMEMEVESGRAELTDGGGLTYRSRSQSGISKI
jgi:hypothetical protein